MAFSLGNLNQYVGQEDLFVRSIMGGSLISDTDYPITVIPNIKGKTDIPILNTTLQPQVGSCSWNPSGTTAINSLAIEVSAVKFDEELCVADLDKMLPIWKVKAGSYDAQLPEEAIFAMERAELISAYNEELIFLGNKVSGVAGLNKANGIFAQLDSATYSGVTQRESVSAVTVSNIISVVDSLVAKLDKNVLARQDKVLYMSMASFIKYCQAVRTANLYHFPIDFNPLQGVRHLESGIMIKPKIGMMDSQRMLLTYSNNVIYACDLASDIENFKFVPDLTGRTILFVADFKVAGYVYVPAQCVVLDIA